MIFYASNFPSVVGFLNKRVSSFENECILPFVAHDAEYKLRNGWMTSFLHVSNSHTCASALNILEDNIIIQVHYNVVHQ